VGAIGEAKKVYEQALTAHGNSPELWLRFGVFQCTYLEDASKKGDASVSFATAARLARGTQFAETVDEVRVAFGGVVGVLPGKPLRLRLRRMSQGRSRGTRMSFNL